MQYINNNTNTIQWFKNSIISLAISGLYFLVYIIFRTCLFCYVSHNQLFIHSVIIIYINLSILVWFLSITAMMWSLNKFTTGFENVYSRLVFCGILLIACSPICSDSVAVMNNHIPMLENIFFILGLSLFASGILCFAIQTVVVSFIQCSRGYGGKIIAIMNFTSSCMFLCIWICFMFSYVRLNNLAEILLLDLDFYYEMLYWSGGYVLQFIYTQLFMLSLLVIVEVYTGGEIKYSSLYEVLLAFNFFLSFTVFVGHARFDLANIDFKLFYSVYIMYITYLVPTIFIITLYFEVVTAIGNKNKLNTFVLMLFYISSFLFIFGRVIASVMIVEHNRFIFGTSIGMHLASMGLVYISCCSHQIQHTINNNLGVVSQLLIPFNKLAPMLEIKVQSWQSIVIIGLLSVTMYYAVF